MRRKAEMEKLITIAEQQVKVSKARDYWEGVLDSAKFAMGEMPQAIEAWLMVGKDKP